LYDYRTLFHGTSTHPKEDQREVAGEKAHSKKLTTCRQGASVRVDIPFCPEISFSILTFLTASAPQGVGQIVDTRR
jgi:hypothetical protein